MQRLNKFIASSGLCSRRKADELIESGKVSVNGKIARASYDVKEGDVIEIQMGEHLLRARVLLVSEHATKTDASAMYQILP